MPAGTATPDTADTPEDHRFQGRRLAAECKHQCDHKLDKIAVFAHSSNRRPIASGNAQVGCKSHLTRWHLLLTADLFEALSLMKVLLCSHLTAFGLRGNDTESCEYDEDVAALVDALPQLRALELCHFAISATDAGIAVRHRCLARWCNIIPLRHHSAARDFATPLAELSLGHVAVQSIMSLTQG